MLGLGLLLVASTPFAAEMEEGSVMPPVSAKEWLRAHPEFKMSPKPILTPVAPDSGGDGQFIESIANPYAKLDDLVGMRQDLEELKGLLKESLRRNNAMEARIAQQDGQIRTLGEQVKKLAVEVAKPQPVAIPRPPMGGFFGSLVSPSKLAEALKIPRINISGAQPPTIPIQPDRMPPPLPPLAVEVPKAAETDDGDYEDDSTLVAKPVDYARQVKSLDEILGKYNYYKIPGESPDARP
jgi:hypothetical protein